jgi:hypothetical protein
VGKFQKGMSDNPAGRPRRGRRTAIELRELRELARQHAPGCIAGLAQMAGLVPGAKAAHNETARIAACIALLDRGFGRPEQTISGDSNRPLLVDFRWADATPAISPLARQPARQPITIEVEAESGDAKAPPASGIVQGLLPDLDRC